jgi:subtilisin family serine protease
VLPGWNYVGDDADTRDVALGVDSNDDGVVDDAVGHGTFVAGLVSLVAPSAKILPYRVLDSDGVGNVYIAYQAILDATASGADVINLSFGSPAKGSSHLLSDAIKSAQRAGVVVVAAAGNDGTTHQQYPAAQTEVLSVAALDGTALPTFSSRGKWVDVSAPGVGIVGPLPGGRYALWAGTSTAAPFVAGQVALMRSLAPSLSAKTLREAVDKTSRDLPKGSGNDPAPRSIDIVAALDYLAH